MALETHDGSGTARTRDGRQLFFERHGAGAPVVVFEAGMGASRHMWGAVAPAVAAQTSTVVYDRSGLGKSPRDPGDRRLPRLVDDLEDLLGELGGGPFVLVGHSWGGPIIRAVSARIPESVAGMVLVDQTDEGCDLFFSTSNERQGRMFARITPVVARLGMGRVIATRMARSLPEPSAQGMRDEDGTVDAMRAHAAEMIDSTADLRVLRADPPALPDVPVTLISGTKPSRMEGARRTDLVAAHRERAESLPQGRHVVAANSSHMVPFTDPEIVVAEILRVVDLVRLGPAEADNI